MPTLPSSACGSSRSAACVIVKHANPCGVCQAATLLDAYEAAYRTDPTSAFGGIIAFNQELDATTARSIIARQFAEVIAAPGVTAEARAVLAQRPNIRVLALARAGHADGGAPSSEVELRSVAGGLLVQTPDVAHISAAGLRVVTRRAPTPQELQDLDFAWRVCRFVKSNAIVFARDGATIGVGAGQMSRVYSTKVAALKAADEKLDRGRFGAGVGCVLSVSRWTGSRRAPGHPGGHSAGRVQAR